MGSNDLWDPPDDVDPGVRKMIVGDVELTLPPKPRKGAFEKALNAAREKMARKDARDQGFAGVVSKSAEWHRIQAIPRRSLDFDEITDLTPIFRAKGGTMELRAIQSAALLEAHIANGLFGPIGVGYGKTLITLLMPEAMDSERTVLLVPPQLRDQLAREIDEVYGPHFNLPLERIVRILAYSELSLAKNTDLLDQLEPDLIIADEAHNLRRSTSARTKRFLRYMRDNPHCRFVGLSGTMTTRSVLDYAHLLELALRKNSPLPNNYKELKSWSGALDVEPAARYQPGVLQQFCADGENVRQGFRRRLVETEGVVATEESAIGTSLIIANIQPDFVPEAIVSALQEAADTWAYEGEEYSDPLSLSRFMRQMSCGFYYRWIWPDGRPDEEWLDARAAWKSAARNKVKQGRVGMDSELLVSNAAERWRKSIEDHSKCTNEECKVHPGPDVDKLCTRKPPVEYGPDSVLFECEEWIAWKCVKARYNPTPPTETVWVSDWLAYDAVRKAQEAVTRGHKVILWYTHKAMGERLTELSGWPHFGQGQDASASKENVIICSTTTQGTGKNLQHYDLNILISMPTNGKDFEQLVGRTHRPGQMADEVWLYYYDHTAPLDAAMDAVIADSIYIQDSTGQRQKVLYADGERIHAKKQAQQLRQTRQG
jgi:hypothetical protein